jgi:excisionase family DNA binding protein
MSKKRLLSVNEAASLLRISPARVRALIGAGRLPAEKVGWAWIIRPANLEKIRVRTVGRPPKAP